MAAVYTVTAGVSVVPIGAQQDTNISVLCTGSKDVLLSGGCIGQALTNAVSPVIITSTVPTILTAGGKPSGWSCVAHADPTMYSGGLSVEAYCLAVP